MPTARHFIVKPPPGRPCWVGEGDVPLRYLGWGTRDFRSFPVGRHRDVGVSFYLVTKGDLTLSANGVRHRVQAPCACIIDRECLFCIGNGASPGVEILVWVWRDPPLDEGLRPPAGGVRLLALRPEASPRLAELHRHCRDEAARNDAASVRRTLPALRTLVEVELLRASAEPLPEDGLRWEQVKSWIGANLAIHAPVPALCDYLRMSPSTLNRFFMKHAGGPPGAYFREAKLNEARRLIRNEGWPVKTAAFHLGYRHATDLSRALGQVQTRRQA